MASTPESGLKRYIDKLYYNVGGAIKKLSQQVNKAEKAFFSTIKSDC
jgi:hypothetical protein